jgi:hypothetical protein
MKITITKDRKQPTPNTNLHFSLSIKNIDEDRFRVIMMALERCDDPDAHTIYDDMKRAAAEAGFSW